MTTFNTPETILITGAAGGICLRLAELLAELQHRLILVDTDGEALERVKARLSANVVDTWVLDVCDADAGRKHYATLRPDDRPTVLVNGVGGDARRIPLEEIDEVALDQSLRHNLTSAFLMTQLCVGEMKERRRGRIVFLSSIAGRTYSVFSNAAYVAAKAGVEGFMKQCAFELAEYGITANAVAHGPISTARIEAAWQAKGAEEQREILARIPLGRHGSLDEAAHFIVPFCAGPAGFATGAVIDVNGGMLI